MLFDVPAAVTSQPLKLSKRPVINCTADLLDTHKTFTKLFLFLAKQQVPLVLNLVVTICSFYSGFNGEKFVALNGNFLCLILFRLVLVLMGYRCVINSGAVSCR